MSALNLNIALIIAHTEFDILYAIVKCDRIIILPRILLENLFKFVFETFFLKYFKKLHVIIRLQKYHPCLISYWNRVLDYLAQPYCLAYPFITACASGVFLEHTLVRHTPRRRLVSYLFSVYGRLT